MRLYKSVFALMAVACASPSEAPPAEAARPWASFAPGAGPGGGRSVVLVAGDEEYRSEEALPMLARLLAERHGFRCTVLFSQNEAGEIDPEARGNVPGLELLADADLLVLFTRFRRLPDTQMHWIVDHVERGRPVVGLRTATHAFAYPGDHPSCFAHWSWDDEEWEGGFGKQVLGETWVEHHGRHGAESTRGVVPDAARDHPILRGVEDVWGPTDVYAIRSLPDDATVLLEGSVRAGMTPDAPPVTDGRNDPRMPIAWLREREVAGAKAPQRVVCSTIGAATDLECEDLRRFLVNAIYWSVGLEDAIPARNDARVGGEYDPTDFGFGKFVRGRRPADFTPASGAGR